MATISRRELLAWMAAGTGAVATGVTLRGGDGGDGGGSPIRPAPKTTSAGLGDASADAAASANQPTAAAAMDRTVSSSRTLPPVEQRVLVVIEMPGGNDGQSTVVPYGMAGYYDARIETAIAAEDVLVLDDEVGLHPALTEMAARGVGVVEGVGARNPDGSHFEMSRRWWSGSSETGHEDTGWLGRLADAIGDPAAPASAISIGSGAHPILRSRSIPTLALPGADAAWYLAGATNDDDLMRASFQRGLRQYGEGAGSSSAAHELLRSTAASTVAFAEQLVAVDEPDDDGVDYPGGTLSDGLAFTRHVIGLAAGIRIIHVMMDGDFDTHENHAGRHDELMGELDGSLAAFREDLAQHGMDDRVLVMTTSEFGRTIDENGSAGLDHGTASTMLLDGPIVPGRYGEAPTLTERDDNNDLIATVDVESYLASVVESWLGVPPSEVVEGNPDLLNFAYA